ncbi:MAG: hypothetical protein KAT28_00410 [Candidatus Aenigmarchaeota archaeon]|nr:hypothetical protein [Candidatus Aenigmarchaeota archaeon]
MEKKIKIRLICLLILIVLFIGYIQKDNIQKNELILVSAEEIIILGKIESMRDSISELHITPGFADFSNFDEAYIELYSSQKSIIYVDRNPNKRRPLAVIKFEKNPWYELSIKNKILKVVITNPLDVELNNLIIQSRDFDDKRIDKILPGESKELTWEIDCKKIQPSVYLEIKSEYLSNKLNSINDSSLTDKSHNIFVYIYETLWPTSLECPIPAEIGIMSVDELYEDEISKKPVKVGEDFNAQAIIKNYGDLIAKNVRCDLRLPPELITSDNLIKHIDVLPNFEKKINWTITAKEEGTHSFEVVVSFENKSSNAIIFVPVAIDNHDIELILDKSLLGDNNTLQVKEENYNRVFYINLTINNLGELEDEVKFDFLVTNDLQQEYFKRYKEHFFSPEDGGISLFYNSVLIPPKGNKTVSLIINKYTEDDSLPDNAEIQIYATSKLDPTAWDKVIFKVKRRR